MVFKTSRPRCETCGELVELEGGEKVGRAYVYRDRCACGVGEIRRPCRLVMGGDTEFWHGLTGAEVLYVGRRMREG